jgi:UDP-N-acetylglucosamine 2-epimerase (non-hydrolysing)
VKILTVVGARPNFMKVAPIIQAIGEANRGITTNSTGDGAPSAGRIEHLLVHTGQHYDEVMSGSFFTDLNLPKPDVHLGVGSASHAAQTAEIMRKFEGVVKEHKPDVIIVVGDVNSTLACALVTAKMSFDNAGSRPLIAHVESGLRSLDRSMPEEVNRVLTDHLSDLLFVTEESGLYNLQKEGISAEKIHFVGNTMIDSLLTYKEKAEESRILDDLVLRKHVTSNPGREVRKYGLLTLHRPSNVDDPKTFQNILAGMNELAKDCPIIFPVHPRTQQRIAEFGIKLHQQSDQQPNATGIVMTNPLGYLDFLCLMKHATIVVTDSGGIQEETTCLGVPCVTVRENTERPVTVDQGTNVIAGTDCTKIREAIRQQLRKPFTGSAPRNWDGRSAKRIVDVLSRTLTQRTLVTAHVDA